MSGEDYQLACQTERLCTNLGEVSNKMKPVLIILSHYVEEEGIRVIVQGLVVKK